MHFSARIYRMISHTICGYMNEQQKTVTRSKTQAWARANNLRPDRCELCGISVQDIQEEHARCGEILQLAPRRLFIVAHHWKGYEYPFDVWWICFSCNKQLHHRHDGSLTKEEARQLVSKRSRLRDGNIEVWDMDTCMWVAKYPRR